MRTDHAPKSGRNNLEFRGFDSSGLLILRGGIPRSVGGLPRNLESAILSPKQECFQSRLAARRLAKVVLPKWWGSVRGTVDFRNFIVFCWAETLAHWNPTSCQKKSIHNEFVRIWDSQIENSKIEIMETGCKGKLALASWRQAVRSTPISLRQALRKGLRR